MSLPSARWAYGEVEQELENMTTARTLAIAAILASLPSLALAQTVVIGSSPYDGEYAHPYYTGQVYAQQQYNEQAYPQPPYNEQAYPQPPYNEQAYAQQPYNEQAYAQQPYNEQAYAQQPYNEQAYAQQPYNEQAYAQPYYAAYAGEAYASPYRRYYNYVPTYRGYVPGCRYGWQRW
jgi:hypothetical protein